MSRPLKLVAAVLVLAAGGAVALAAGSAPARTRSHAIICPLEPSDTITYPCCGPPVATAGSTAAVYPCCGTPLPINCPVGLTLSSSADPSVAGHKITLSGHSPAGTAGQTVDLFQELPGATTFSKVAQTKTGSLGDFQFVRKGVQTNRKWYVKAGSEQSITIAQKVKAVVRLTRALDVRTMPNHACENALLQRRAGQRWVKVATLDIRGRVNRNPSRFCASAVLAGRGEFRAVFPGDTRNVRSVSNTVHR
jgi:hypothetical protein